MEKINYLYWAIGILSLLFTISLYVIRNMLKKYEKLLEEYDVLANYAENFNINLKVVDDEMKKMQEKGLFEGDAEIDVAYKVIKVMTDDLLKFSLNQDDRETNKKEKEKK